MVNRRLRIFSAFLFVLQIFKANCQYAPVTSTSVPIANTPSQIGQLILPAVIEPTAQTVSQFQVPMPFPSPPCSFPPPPCFPSPPMNLPNYQNQPPQVIILDDGSSNNNMDLLYLLLIASKGGGLFGGNSGGCGNGGGCGCGGRCGGNCGYGYYSGGVGCDNGVMSYVPPISLTITTASSDSESQSS
ncbi:WAS/WASL-interacting protein family member 1-like [Achroia grisella]|uniref:WAS/WASL-interacting protein family member 1-like n=1 Tax=Achroia grisella TaxID=688607 RepID=UPI0027D23A79|nr:WAS/WASL-interacting protein family member 1-like [Achroia grisella]